MASNHPKYTSKLLNTRILVLGGTSGIGFCIAEAALEHGAYVCISGSRQLKLEQAISRLQTAYPEARSKVSGHVCDLSQREQLQSNLDMLLRAAAGDKKIDHIAFTAGNSFKVAPITEVNMDDILAGGQVRFLAPLLIAKLAPKYLAPGPKSSITFTGGIRSHKPAKGWAMMVAWGSGIEGMARGLAMDLAPMRINVVNPGAVHTELFDSIPKDRLESVLKAFREGALVGEVGKPEDLAEAYIHCMKDYFANGTVFSIDGGAMLT